MSDDQQRAGLPQGPDGRAEPGRLACLLVFLVELSGLDLLAPVVDQQSQPSHEIEPQAATAAGQGYHSGPDGRAPERLRCGRAPGRIDSP